MTSGLLHVILVTPGPGEPPFANTSEAYCVLTSSGGFTLGMLLAPKENTNMNKQGSSAQYLSAPTRLGACLFELLVVWMDAVCPAHHTLHAQVSKVKMRRLQLDGPTTE